MKIKLIIPIAMMALLGSFAQERRTVTQPLVASESKIGPSRSIPVCWENASSDEATERGWVGDAVENSWERASRVRFTGEAIVLRTGTVFVYHGTSERAILDSKHGRNPRSCTLNL